jgi:hypothetical protein
MDDPRRAAATAVAAGRLGYGALMTLAPRTLLRVQTGSDPTGPIVWLARAFGARDALLGLGTLIAPGGPDRRRWVALSAAADAVDALAAVAGIRWLGRRNSAVVAATATAAAATAAWSLSGD